MSTVELVGGGLAARFDALLSEEIQRRLGGAGWRVEDLKGRLNAVTWAGQQFTDYCLDGVPLVRVWPAEIEVSGNQIRAFQRIERLQA